MSENQFRPCSFKQQEFLKSDATVTVYGGSMGAAKTHGGLLRHLRWVRDQNYVGYVIRKNETVLRDGGGAFDAACKLYKIFDPKCRITLRPMQVIFSSGAKINFKGFADDRAKEDYRGKQLSGVMVDEGTQLTEDQIDMLISRLRTEAKMTANIWITCNPDPDSYLFEWVEWYLYPKGTVIDGNLVEGRPDPKKNGKLRYMLRVNGKYVFESSKEELIEKYQHLFQEKILPKTFRFIGATVYDNPPLLKNNPEYLNNLQGLPRVAKERDLYGNWLARAENTGYFKRDWLGEPLTHVPMDVKSRVRCWDLAASLKTETNPDPDYTVGVLMSKTLDGKFVIEDVYRDRKRHGDVIKEVARIAHEDEAMFGDVQVYIPEDGGQAGKVAAAYMIQQLAEMGIGAKKHNVGTKSKLNRFKPFCASAENGSVHYVKAEWNNEFLYELEAFDGTRKAVHDDRHYLSSINPVNSVETSSRQYRAKRSVTTVTV